MKGRWASSLAWGTVVAVLLSGYGAPSARAQGFQGGLRGAVKDAGGVIPGVQVTLTNEGTTISRQTVTNDVGEYTFPAVPAGVYSKATLAGFKTFERRGLTIATQQFITLDIVLEVGGLQESMVVTGSVPLIEVSNASIGQVLSSETIKALPSLTRNAFMMAATAPTYSANVDPRQSRMQDQSGTSLVSLGGGLRGANNYVIDGVPITDMVNRPALLPTMEALEDIKVQVHTYDAEMGRTGGGVFNVTARSGERLVPRWRVVPDAAGMGDGEQLLQRPRRNPDAAGPLLQRVRRKRWRADHQEQDVLLGGHGGVSRQVGVERATDPAHRPRARRRLLADLRPQRRTSS